MQADIYCFSHLRWDFVYQRPQHLLSRFGAHHRVFFIEEPVFDAAFDTFAVRKEKGISLYIITPQFIAGLSHQDVIDRQKIMVDYLLHMTGNKEYIVWYYTPMALQFTDHLDPVVTVYDCMDELSGFKFSPPELIELEEQLLRRADVMFTGGKSLYLAKKSKHHNIFSFPSSVDKDHFMSARLPADDRDDQRKIAHPRLGFFGVIDERFDHELIRQIAFRRPNLNFIVIGPIVKIDPNDLPQAGNIHYLGSKPYSDLPQYLAGWDIALMPFLKNASTRFISPTKTPEYLCGGKPVISTSIHDVIDPYEFNGLVRVADTTEDFIQAIDDLLIISPEARDRWLCSVDEFLADKSWDNTYEEMASKIRECMAVKILKNENSRWSENLTDH